MTGSILRDILNILNECTLELEITETIFLDTLYPNVEYTTSKSAKKKAASKIFSGDIAVNKKSLLLKATIRFTLEEAFDEWLIDEEQLEEKIEAYIKTSPYFDNSQKKSLLQKKELKLRLIELIHHGIVGVDVTFNKHLLKTRFIGREDDIEVLDEILQKHKVCYLHGVNGIGKTTLVREYARIHQLNYIELKYSGNLKDTLDRSSNFRKKKSYDELLKKLDDSVLLMIDDINENYYEDAGFNIINELDCKVVLVFYHEPDLQFDEYGDDKKMEVKELSLENLKCLFYQSVKRKKADAASIIGDDVEKLIKSVYQNTYFVILCANLIKNGYTIEKLNDKLSCSIIKIDSEIGLRTEIYQEKKTYDQLASVLYNMEKFSEPQKEILFLLSNFRNWGVNRAFLDKLWHGHSCNILNSLIESGWVEQYGNNVILYAIPAEYVKTELNDRYQEKEKISYRLLESAIELITQTKSLQFPLSWILALYDIASNCVIGHDMACVFLLDVFELLLGEYPEISYLEKILKRMDAFHSNRYLRFNIEHYQHVLLCVKGDEDLARKGEQELIEELTKYEKKAIDLDDEKKWCEVVELKMKCFKTIRDTIGITISKGKATDEVFLQIQELNDNEFFWSYRIRYVCEKDARLKSMLTGYTPYFINYYLYCLKWLDLSDEENTSLLNYLEEEGEGIAIQVEIHKVKSRIAELKENHIEALSEIYKAIELVHQLDSPLYYMECILEKLGVEFVMGRDKNYIMEQVKQLEKDYIYRENNLVKFVSVENGIKLLKERCSDVLKE